MTIPAQATVIVPTETDAAPQLEEAAAALTEAAVALTEAAAEQTHTLPSTEPSGEVITALRLMKDNIDLLMKRIEQLEGRQEERLARMDRALDDLEGALELVSREIGRADELVERHGKATAALVELHERQRTAQHPAS